MFPKLTPVTKNIIIACVALYILAIIFPYLNVILPAYYPFSPNFRSYQIITHMFMHAPLGSSMGITHILFNLLTLWSFGPVLEQVLGAKKYTILYFVSGLGAFFLFNLFNFYQIHELQQALEGLGVNVADVYHKASFNQEGSITLTAPTQQGLALSKILIGALQSPMMGASGAIFGVVAAFATLFPEAKLFLMFIPIPIKAKYLVIGAVVLSIYFQFSGTMGGVAHMAHVGGALTGYLMARAWKNNRYRIN